MPAGPRRVCVAFSGGLDSTVLLCALAQVRSNESFELRAVHVDHQLQPSSGAWAEHCRRIAGAHDVPLTVMRVEVEKGSDGLEAAARKARYDALRGVLAEDEVLVTAHHANDQLETMLLALVRGAGVRGLSAMAGVQRFGCGWLARPLMEFTREALHAWARAQELAWIEDPMNEVIGLDRNYIRHQVVPLLRARWPASEAAAVRSARHLSEAQHLLDELAQEDAARAAIEDCLDVSILGQLTSARRRNLLRCWLRFHGVRAPSTRKLTSIEHDIVRAARDRTLRIALDGAELRRHRNVLYCVARMETAPRRAPLKWPIRTELELPDRAGTLRLEAQIGAGIRADALPNELEVRFRQGGESIQLPGEAHHRTLKKVLQEGDVLPWWRSRLPLIHAGDKLLGVGDLWVDAAVAARAEEPGLVVRWIDKPRIHAVRRSDASR